MINIRYAKQDDSKFWFKLDGHLSEKEFSKKVRDSQCYILCEDDEPKGILRYNLFWDNTPFCNMLFVDWDSQRKGYGSKLMAHWENEMRSMGYGMIMTSTQVDETAQHFYRKIGYKDCGGLLIEIPGYEQPMEMFFCKDLRV